MMITMVNSYDPGDVPTDSTSDGTPPEPRVTLGVVMFVTALVPIVAVQYFTPELAGKLLTAMIPLLLIAVLRTSITPYTVFESVGRR
jgi:hypothetical protein